MTQTLFLPSLHQWTRQKQVDGRCSALVPAVWWSLWKLLSNHVCEHVWSLPHLEAMRVWGPGGNEQPEVEAGDPGGQAAEAGLAQRCTHSAWLHSCLQTPGPQRAGSVQRAAWLAGPPKGPGTAPAPRAQPALHLPSSPLCGLRGQSCWEGAQH